MILISNTAKSKLEKAESHMTREELERHLESRQHSFKIEKAPAMLPMEIFSNDNSNPDRFGFILRRIYISWLHILYAITYYD